MGGAVTWENKGNFEHSATEAAGGTLPSYSLNGRTFVGDTPIVVASSGRRIRWHVFNLDLAMTWHNFHLHGARWRWDNHVVDTRSAVPTTVGHGNPITITTPNESSIGSVALLRPAAMTHHTDAGARYIHLAITGRGGGQLMARAPATANIAPPGWYMLFIVSNDGVPALGTFIQSQ